MPDWKGEIERRLAGLELEPAREAEIAEELAQHLDDRYQEMILAGAGEDEARCAALDDLSDSQLLAKEIRQTERQARGEPVILGGTRRASVMADLWQDMKFAARVLRKNLGFTVVAVLSLVLGIGANTAIFQLLNAITFRTLPVEKPHEIAEIRITDMTGARGNFSSLRPQVTNPIWEKIRDNQQVFSGAFAWGADSFNLAAGGEARYARGLWVSGDFFNALGIKPILGRVITVADDFRGCGSAGAVISHAFWQREFGGDPSIIGKKLMLDYQSIEIIGVTPASFFGLEVGQSFDVALPLCSETSIRGVNDRLDEGTVWWLTVMGRLKPGWSLEQATSHLESISPGVFNATLPPDYPSISVDKYLGFKLEAVDAGSGFSELRETYTTPLWLLLAIAGLVLLIACANLANLMLARASARKREIAIRLALGASRGRLIRQLLAESLLLAAIGAALGILLAQFLSQFLVSFISTEGSPLFVELSTDWLVLAFTVGLTALTCILFGLAPALRATNVDPGAVMKAGARGLTASRERYTLRRALVVTQVALSLILVVAAFMFSRSLGNLLSLDAGFNREGMVIASVDFSRLSLPREQRHPFKRDLLDRIRSIPGVDAAATANVVPLSGNGWRNNVWMEGADSQSRRGANLSRISSEYFKTLGAPILAGRDFDYRDTDQSEQVAIVNESFARQLLDGENPVGKRFWIEKTPYDPERQFQIVGLVKDTKYENIREEYGPIIFLAASQTPRHGQFDQVLIRSNNPSAAMISAATRAIAEISPDIVTSFQVFELQIDDSLLRERLMATLSAFFGGLALLLACVGLYGIMSYGVASRTSEIGIRMALGAERRDVMRLIMREALVLVLIGVVIGVPAVLGAGQLVSSLLFGLAPTDPISIALAALVMLVVSAAAGYIPARRASRVDPMVALRYE